MYCTIPDCGKPVENRDLGLCASHAREQRKAEERASRVKIVQTELKKVSPKMAKALQEYSKLSKIFLEANPQCAVYPDKKSIEVHHGKGRATIELLLDDTYWVAVSREGHIWIETHPQEAKEKGFSISRLAKTEPKN